VRVGERIRERRLELGLTQRGIASPGVSYAYVSRIEAGQRVPSVKALRKLATALDVSAYWLEHGEPDPGDVAIRAGAVLIERQWLNSAEWASALDAARQALLAAMERTPDDERRNDGTS